MHKLEPLLRLPLALGLAHLLGRIPLPGSAPRREWVQAFAHPERDKRVAVGMVVLVALAAATSLAWTGRLTPPGAFDAIPQYWHDTADWLDEHNSAGGRVLVAPGAPFATQVWGTSHDEPLQVLGNSPWGVRDSIPLTPPETIRALDSVQRLFAAGRPSAGLADTLARQGISYVVVRNDLDPETSRSARPLLVHRAIEGSGGLVEGGAVRRARRPRHAGRVSSPTAGCGRASRRWRSTGWTASATGMHPYLADTDAMARVDGGPEALLRLDERRRLLGQPPLGPMLLTARRAARRAARAPVVTVTDTPLARETDYGRVDDHSSAIRDARRSAAHVQPRARLSRRAVPTWSTGSGTADASRCRVRRRIRRRCPTSHPRPGRRRPSTATRRRAGCPMRCRRPSASGCRSTSTIPSPTPPSRSRPVPPPSARRSAASRCRPSTAPARCGSTRRASR